MHDYTAHLFKNGISISIMKCLLYEKFKAIICLFVWLSSWGGRTSTGTKPIPLYTLGVKASIVVQ